MFNWFRYTKSRNSHNTNSFRGRTFMNCFIRSLFFLACLTIVGSLEAAELKTITDDDVNQKSTTLITEFQKGKTEAVAELQNTNKWIQINTDQLVSDYFSSQEFKDKRPFTKLDALLTACITLQDEWGTDLNYQTFVSDTRKSILTVYEIIAQRIRSKIQELITNLPFGQTTSMEIQNYETLLHGNTEVLQSIKTAIEEHQKILEANFQKEQLEREQQQREAERKQIEKQRQLQEQKEQERRAEELRHQQEEQQRIIEQARHEEEEQELRLRLEQERKAVEEQQRIKHETDQKRQEEEMLRQKEEQIRRELEAEQQRQEEQKIKAAEAIERETKETRQRAIEQELKGITQERRQIILDILSQPSAEGATTTQINALVNMIPEQSKSMATGTFDEQYKKIILLPKLNKMINQEQDDAKRWALQMVQNFVTSTSKLPIEIINAILLEEESVDITTQQEEKQKESAISQEKTKAAHKLFEQAMQQEDKKKEKEATPRKKISTAIFEQKTTEPSFTPRKRAATVTIKRVVNVNKVITVLNDITNMETKTFTQKKLVGQKLDEIKTDIQALKEWDSIFEKVIDLDTLSTILNDGFFKTNEDYKPLINALKTYLEE